jgi:hypothetical protein
MKAKLKFNLPEDNWEYAQANKSKRLRLAADEFADFLRKEEKYGNLTEEELSYQIKVSEAFWDSFDGLLTEDDQ